MSVYSRTHHLLLSAWGKRWRKVNVVMFTAHIDDSGSDPAQAVANATALIIPARRILALEREWDALKIRHGFSCFHMAEFSARNPDSEFANWDDLKHDLVFTRVREICKKYGVQAMSITVYKKDYDEVVPADFRKHTGLFHYTWAMRCLLSHTQEWRKSKNSQPLEYVFDWMGEKKKNPRRHEIEDLLEHAEEIAAANGMAGEFANWSFRRREEIPGLQCVDVVAWSTYQFGLLAFKKKPLPPDAKTAWDDFGKHSGGNWGFDVTITRDDLKKWIDAELADGRSIARFKAREERKKAEHAERKGKC